MRDFLEGLAIERKHFVQTFEPEKEPQENVVEQQQNQGRLKEQQQKEGLRNLLDDPIVIVPPKSDFLVGSL